MSIALVSLRPADRACDHSCHRGGLHRVDVFWPDRQPCRAVHAAPSPERLKGFSHVDTSYAAVLCCFDLWPVWRGICAGHHQGGRVFFDSGRYGRQCRGGPGADYHSGRAGRRRAGRSLTDWHCTDASSGALPTGLVLVLHWCHHLII